MTDAPKPDRVITARMVRKGEDEKEFDRAFWREQTYTTRLNAAFQMVVDMALIRGQDVRELRLQRDVVCLKRRKR